MILDTKMPLDIDTHPWFADEAMVLRMLDMTSKCRAICGYTIVMLLTWIFGSPTPVELLNGWDDIEYMVNAIEAIDMRVIVSQLLLSISDEAVIQN